MSSSTGIIHLFKEFTESLPTKLISKNTDMRKEVVDVVSELADELSRGLELAIIRLQGAKQLDTEAELVAYLAESRRKLVELHSEFKICRGLRNLRVKEKTLFDKPTYAVEIAHRDRVKQLLYEMEKDERLIYDELGTLLQDAESLAQRLKTKNAGISDVQKWLIGQIKALRARQDSLKTLAREFIENARIFAEFLDERTQFEPIDGKSGIGGPALLTHPIAEGR